MIEARARNLKCDVDSFLSSRLVTSSKNHLQYWKDMLTSEGARLTGGWLTVEELFLIAFQVQKEIL